MSNATVIVQRTSLSVRLSAAQQHAVYRVNIKSNPCVKVTPVTFVDISAMRADLFV